MNAPSPRLAILSPLFSGESGAHGGITPVILNLTHALAARGIDIDLLVRLPRAKRAPSADLPARVSIINLDTHHRLTTAIAVTRYLRNSAPTALLAAGHRFNLAAAWARRFAPAVRVVVSVHNTVSVAAGERGRFKRWQRLRSVRLSYPRADGIIAVSQGVADDLVEHAGIARRHITVLHNPIVTPQLIERSKETPDHSWFVPGATPVILGAGRLVSQKAFHILIRAFAEARTQRDCRLVILGEGPLRGELEALVRELKLEPHVALPGFVANPYAYMRRAAVFALSSDFEGFGNVLVESMAVGTPVVSTDCPSGPGEILAGGRYGRLTPPGNVPALAHALLETLAQTRDAASLSAAVERFHADNVAARYLSCLGLA